MNTNVHIISFSYSNSNDQLIFQITAQEEDDCFITLSDESGKIVRMFGLSLAKGINKITLDQKKPLPDCWYNLNIRNTKGMLLFNEKIC